VPTDLAWRAVLQDLRNLQNMNEFVVSKHGTEILNAVKV
jgi:hypothetical protein